MKKLLVHLLLSIVLIPALLAQPQAWKNYYSKYSLSSFADIGNTIGFVEANQLVQFDKTTGYFSYQEIPFNVLPCNSEHQPFQYYVRSFNADPSGNYWMLLGTQNLYGSIQPTNLGAFYKYDGANWTSFTSTLANAGYDSLVTPYFDNRGNMWFTCTQGLVKYNGSSFTTWDTLNTLLASGYLGQSLAFDTSGNLWAPLYGLGVLKFDGTHVTIYDTTAFGVPPGLSYQFYIAGLYINPATNYVYATNGYGTDTAYYQYNGTSWTPVNLSNFYNSSNGYYTVYNIFFDLAGNMYLCMEQGILKYNGSTYTLLTNLPGYQPGIYNNVYYEETDAAGLMWLVVNGQFASFDGTNFTTYQDARAVLESNIMVTELPDKSGNLWLSYWGSAGLTKETNGVFTSPIKAGNASGATYAMTMDSAGQIWLAGANVCRFDPTTDSLVIYPVNSGCTYLELTGITVDKNNNVWTVGYSGSGCSVFAEVVGNTVQLQNLNLANPMPWFTSITADSAGYLWIGTADDSLLGFPQTGLIKFDGTNVTQYTTANSGLPDNQVQSLGVGPDGRLWVGTYSAGVAVFDGTKWTVYDSINSGLPDNHIECFYFYQGKVYVGTQWDGFAVFDGTNWTAYTPQNSPLVDVDCESVVVDAQCNVWAATECGLSEMIGQCNQDFTILFGKVTKEDGTRLPNTLVNLLKYDSIAKLMRILDNTYTDANGQYSFATQETGLYVQGVPNDKLYQFTMPGYQDSALVQQQPAPIKTTRGASKLADIVCVAAWATNGGGVTLEGTAVKASGGKAVGLRLFLMQYNLPVATTVTEVNGHYKFANIQPGSYTIWADHMDINNKVAPGINFTHTGIFTATVTVHDTYLELLATGILQPEEQLSFGLYPNPNAGKVFCHLEAASYQNATLDIYTITGAHVFGKTVSTGTNELDLQQLPNGIYIAQLNTATGTLQQKLVIQR